MAGGDEYLNVGGAGWGGPLAAVMLMGAGTNVYDAFSAVMSSPWSTEKFTADSDEERMARTYVKHAMCISWGYAIAGAALVMMDPGSPDSLAVIPLVGAAGATIYMYWLYNRALSRAMAPDAMRPGGSNSENSGQNSGSNSGSDVPGVWSP